MKDIADVFRLAFPSTKTEHVYSHFTSQFASLLGIAGLMALDNNGLHGNVDPWLGSLARLEKLTLHDNDFAGAIPGEVCLLRDSLLSILSADCFEVDCSCCNVCCDEIVGCTRAP